MHADKKHDGQGLEAVHRTTARPIDESLVKAASSQPGGSVPPDAEIVARPTRRRFTAAERPPSSIRCKRRTRPSAKRTPGCRRG